MGILSNLGIKLCCIGNYSVLCVSVVTGDSCRTLNVAYSTEGHGGTRMEQRIWNPTKSQKSLLLRVMTILEMTLDVPSSLDSTRLEKHDRMKSGALKSRLWRSFRAVWGQCGHVGQPELLWFDDTLVGLGGILDAVYNTEEVDGSRNPRDCQWRHLEKTRTLVVATWVDQALYVQSTEWVTKLNKLDPWEDIENLNKE